MIVQFDSPLEAEKAVQQTATAILVLWSSPA
jgi:hypothetical protein